ncbi:N-acyl-D-amino-acid deacylase family protein [Rhodohalobacter halophilus]|uniref:N-acyl-D-amino-acid deacylase family protein n=1 Tax=Rhodohalobacter halophilus TaxID=1812810 RepID=UPI00083F7BF5|nr:D-aminoacylase [Rhodohalobacter halophilus]
MLNRLLIPLLAFATLFASCTAEKYDIVITNGIVYDGSGDFPDEADIGIRGDKIVTIGTIHNTSGAKKVINAGGKAVTPGFINMLSWGAGSLLNDGRSMSGIKQGVTLELFGEGSSVGPLSEEMQRQRWGDNPSDYLWQTLGEGLQHLEDNGISTNVGSFVGATTLRIHQIGYNDREPTEEELATMKQLTDEAMREGAMGLGTSLIYAPAFYAKTDELIELSKVVGEYDGMYISHMRSEGNRLVESVEELITIGREAGVHAEIHHLKAAGRQNWDKLDQVIEKVEEARSSGQPVTANMYTYDAAATSLAAIFPPWTQDGGHSAWIERLKDPETREQIIEEIKTPSDGWENFYLMAGGGNGIILVGLRSDELQKYVGMTLSEVAAERGDKDEVRTAVDLTVEDNNRIGAIYYLMSEENVQRQIQLPWMSFGSDGGTFAAEGDILNRQMHPRAWGNFARLLGKYVREEKLISLEEAIYRLTGLPATNLKLNNRGLLKEGYYADIVIFDPETIEDHATFENPHQYATGVEHVFVNGIQVLDNGEHTGESPGRFVKGPGYYAAQN